MTMIKPSFLCRVFNKTARRFVVFRIIRKASSYASFYIHAKWRIDIDDLDEIVPSHEIALGNDLIRHINCENFSIYRLGQSRTGKIHYGISRPTKASTDKHVLLFARHFIALAASRPDLIFAYDNGCGVRYRRAKMINIRQLLRIIKKCKYFSLFSFHTVHGDLLFGKNAETLVHVFDQVPGDLFYENHSNPFFDKIDFSQDWKKVIDLSSYPQEIDKKVTPKVDIVYTWVDDTDPYWQDQFNQYSSNRNVTDSDMSHRFRNRDELKYSLRSVAMYADFINHVYIVTADQTPKWLDTKNPKVTVIPHREIFSSSDNLPTFNSHAIESCLHRIPGLSELFIYMNDDFFFMNHVQVSDFFDANGRARSFYSRGAHIPVCYNKENVASIDSAWINTQTFLYKMYGYVVRDKFKHTPRPMIRRIVNDLNTKHPEVFILTEANRFRDIKDYSISSSLAPVYHELVGKGVRSNISYTYLSTNSPYFIPRLHLLRTKDRSSLNKCLCINDTGISPKSLLSEHKIDSNLNMLLEYLYPIKSTFEK